MPIKQWTLGNTAYEILEMIEQTELGICFDVGHAYIMDEVENFLDHVKKFKNVHFHDNSGKRDEHLVLGQGTIDFPYVIERITKEYSGDIIIESNNLEEGIKSKVILQKLLDKRD
jgi:sugar phosphate isomerase/epimerase